jgi:hypothetical protein
MQLNGVMLTGKHPLADHGEVTVKEYVAEVPLVTDHVLAAMATDFGTILQVVPPYGDNLVAFNPGDYIVSDNPPTHAWVVKAAVFEASYKEA